MPRSVRFPHDLEKELDRVASAEGVPPSAIIRRAVQQYCTVVLSKSARDQLTDVIGTVRSKGGRARRSGHAFRRLLRTRRG